MEAFCVASLVVFHQPSHDVEIKFKVHGFPSEIPIEYVVFLRENVWFESEFADGRDEVAAVESCIQTKAVAFGKLNELVHRSNFVFVDGECLHHLSCINDTC